MDNTYIFLQQYWWFVISLLAGLLVFLMFVQGGNVLLFFAKSEEERKMMVNSTGRKWEFTFTTLVTFGGAFFASFPLFYSTSFGGAYWLWMIILFTFVLQAVSYEFQSKNGNLLGKSIYRFFLMLNGKLAPFLVGAAVATFFTGSEFIVIKDNMTETMMPVISTWASPWHGLEALGNIWNWVLGGAVAILAQILGAMYFINNIDDERVRNTSRRTMLWNSAIFVVLFVVFVAYLLLKDGYAVNPASGEIYIEPYKYLHNFLAMPAVTVIFLLGVVLVLAGIALTLLRKGFRKGIWLTGAGTVLAVMGLMMCAGYNNTAYYPSTADLQSSLTIFNSSSSLFTLKTMAYVTILIPFVVAYIFYAWRAIDRKKITSNEMKSGEHTY